MAEGDGFCGGVLSGHETFALASQLQRAAVSIPANISEGQARQHTGEFKHFLSVASGSLAELETHILIATRLGYLTPTQSEDLLRQSEEISKMLRALRQSLNPPPTNH